MAKKTEMLYLSEPDMIKAGVLDSARCVDVLNEVFRIMGEGDYLMGGYNHNEHGHSIIFPQTTRFPTMPVAGPDRRFTSMIAYLGGRFNVTGSKWYGSHVVNPQRGLPRSIHMIILNDTDTCEPFAVLAGNLVSAVRTGCVPGLSTRYLARKNSRVCSLVGAGPINKAAFQAIASQMKSLEELVVFDLFPEKSKIFIDWAEKEFGLAGRCAETLEECVRAGDIVNVAASGPKPVYILDEWISKGAVVILSGRSRFDDAALLNCGIVYDNIEMQKAYRAESVHFDSMEAFYEKEKGGQFFRLIDEGKLPGLDDSVNLCKIATGEQQGRTSDEQRIIYLTAGMSTFDVAWGYECYLKAKEMGIGVTLPLWEEAHWL